MEELYNSTDFKVLTAEHDGIREILKNIFGKEFTFDELFCVFNALSVHVKILLIFLVA